MSSKFDKEKRCNVKKKNSKNVNKQVTSFSKKYDLKKKNYIYIYRN